MPIGSYTVMDGEGRPVGSEAFRASAGPYGWRYVARIDASEPPLADTTVDLTVDAERRPVRVSVDTGAHRLLLGVEGDRLVGVRDDRPVEHPWEEHIDFFSPSFNAVTAARLEGPADLTVAYVDPATLTLRDEAQRYEPLGTTEVTTPVGTFVAEGWRFTALSGGWSRRLWLADLLVVAYEGLYELAEYEPGRTGTHPT